MISKVNRDILKAKKRLMKTPIVENFGQREIAKLNDKYGFYHYASQQEKRQVQRLIDRFAKWCATFTPSGGR